MADNTTRRRFLAPSETTTLALLAGCGDDGGATTTPTETMDSTGTPEAMATAGQMEAFDEERSHPSHTQSTKKAVFLALAGHSV